MSTYAIEQTPDNEVMFRCISPHTAYSIQIVEGNEQVVVDQRGMAKSLELSKPVIARFQQGGLLPHEIEAALERFNFAGLPEGVNPITRLSVYDPEAEALAQGWPPEQLKAVRQKLRFWAEHDPGHFIIVEKPEEPRPWANYDKHTVEEIVQLQEITGIPPEVIRRYEEEHAARAEVIEAMIALESQGGAIVVEA